MFGAVCTKLHGYVWVILYERSYPFVQGLRQDTLRGTTRVPTIARQSTVLAGRASVLQASTQATCCFQHEQMNRLYETNRFTASYIVRRWAIFYFDSNCDQFVNTLLYGYSILRIIVHTRRRLSKSTWIVYLQEYILYTCIENISV